MLLDGLAKDIERIAQTGVLAIAQAHAAGVAAYYIDETIGQGIVKHLPDGTIQLIDPNQDEDVVLRTIAPGPCR
jgi:hypothetical protein